MTNEEIDRMEAGRELDALVAERVMDWRWLVSQVSGRRALFPPDHAPEWFGRVADGSEPLTDQWDTRLPHYSTDIAAAWQVVEKMRERWPVVRLEVDVEGWRVEIHTDEGTPSYYRPVAEDYADTWPLAICRVALKAVAADAPPLEARIAKACDKVLDGLEDQ